MSRIGRQPIPVPDNVEVSIDGREVRVKGPNGEVSGTMPERIATSHEDGEIKVARPSDSAQDRALHGLARTLVANMVRGVTEGYEKRLEIEGVGYRAEAAGAKVKLSLGFSHPIEYDVPDGVEVTTPQPTAQRVAKRAGLMAAKVGQEVLGIVENMSWFTGDDGTRYPIFGEGGGGELAEQLGVPLLAQVPLVVSLREGADKGIPALESDPTGAAAEAFRVLAKEIDQRKPRVRTHPELVVN